MQLSTYIELSGNTEAGADKSDLYRVEHGAIGLLTEGGELFDAYKKAKYYGKDIDMTNVAEEIGDVMWYVALLVRVLGIDTKALENFKLIVVADPVEGHLSAIRRCANSVVGSGQGILREVYNEGRFIFRASNAVVYTKGAFLAARDLCNLLDIDFNSVLEANIEKLSTRYPEKFDAYLAENRDLDAERDAIESNVLSTNDHIAAAVAVSASSAEIEASSDGGDIGVGSFGGE